MKFSFAALSMAALFAASANGSSMLREAGDPCHLTGTYQEGTDISSCSTVNIGPLTVPAGVMLDLSKTKPGATIEFTGTTTFSPQKWDGPLVLLTGSDLTVKGSGVLDGQGDWYWKQGESITRPVFFRLQHVTGSNISGFTVKNSPFRTFSIVTCIQTTITGLTLDSKAGDNRAKNTDGFDLTKNDHVTITGNKIFNQDDCLAMQSSTNTIFSNNLCSGGHGISVGSLGGAVVDQSTTVSGLTVQGNNIVDSENGLRIKTISGLKGLVSNVKYLDNTLSNVKNGIVIHSNYDRALGAYSGAPTSLVKITEVTVSGLSGTATNLYDIVANPSVVSIWTFSGITVKATNKGTCSGQPGGITC
ncbi:Polygalacturonase 1 [Phytophthora boehmeriae]|uniref:endo-polygalacturonase n=1 Tax=Phytophthora boehmeriae TaxID=109152 RepID=A0A8T1X3D9_9STRA|nr:Polygalacturonase 1 [Phytophthora boehmeriae]